MKLLASQMAVFVCQFNLTPAVHVLPGKLATMRFGSKKRSRVFGAKHGSYNCHVVLKTGQIFFSLQNT
jgi:hypothetical protein